MLNPPWNLRRGIPTKVVEAIAATGTAAAHWFSVSSRPGEGVQRVVLQAIGTWSAFAGNIEMSSDGGTTVIVFGTFDFQASPKQSIDITCGVIFRLNTTSLAETVPPDVFAILS